jgi:hypothetical protein
MMMSKRRTQHRSSVWIFTRVMALLHCLATGYKISQLSEFLKECLAMKGFYVGGVLQRSTLSEVAGLLKCQRFTMSLMI